MENKQEEKKGKKALRTVLLIAGTVAVCYEIFGRKGQDVKNAYSWVKGKIQSKKTVEPQNRQQQNGNWNNKQQQRRN